MSASRSWEPLAITRGTVIEHPHEGEYAESGLNARFAAIGWTVEQVEEHIIVREPTSDERDDLRIPPGVPVAEIGRRDGAGGQAQMRPAKRAGALSRAVDQG
jgi:GntR family transcriptional regulator